MEEVENLSWNSLETEEKEKRGGGGMEADGYHRAVQLISPKSCQQSSGCVSRISSKEATHLSMPCCSAAQILRCNERTPSSAHVEAA